MAYSYYDLNIHLNSDPSKRVNTTEEYNKDKRDITLAPRQDGTFGQATFDHTMSGYPSGYYGYLWSKVYSSDMFTRFNSTQNIESPVVGADYRQKVLRPGASKYPIDMLRSFLGREPNNKAFFQDLETPPKKKVNV